MPPVPVGRRASRAVGFEMAGQFVICRDATWRCRQPACFAIAPAPTITRDLALSGPGSAPTVAVSPRTPVQPAPAPVAPAPPAGGVYYANCTAARAAGAAPIHRGEPGCSTASSTAMRTASPGLLMTFSDRPALCRLHTSVPMRVGQTRAAPSPASKPLQQAHRGVNRSSPGVEARASRCFEWANVRLGRRARLGWSGARWSDRNSEFRLLRGCDHVGAVRARIGGDRRGLGTGRLGAAEKPCSRQRRDRRVHDPPHRHHRQPVTLLCPVILLCLSCLCRVSRRPLRAPPQRPRWLRAQRRLPQLEKQTQW